MQRYAVRRILSSISLLGLTVIAVPRHTVADVAWTYHFEVRESVAQSCFLYTVHDPGFDYPGTPELFGCQPLPVKNATWGAIKALYH